MTDFRAAIKRGVAAASKVQRARAEVDEVLADASLALRQSHGVELRRGREPFSGLLSVLPNAPLGEAPETQLEIVRGKRSTRVAGWKQAGNGFPCEVEFDGDTYVASNRVELESAIGALLASASFAFRVMDLASEDEGASGA